MNDHIDENLFKDMLVTVEEIVKNYDMHVGTVHFKLKYHKTCAW